MTLMEVVYRRNDGVIVRTLAINSYRGGPIGEWTVGDIPLSELGGEFIYKGPRCYCYEGAGFSLKKE